jgi:hypothetical protein
MFNRILELDRELQRELGISDTATVKSAKSKKKTIPKVVKDLTWNTWVGDNIAKTKCLCCGVNEIRMNSFHCGHVVAEANGGATTVENLRPICATCNLSMRTENLNAFKTKYGFDHPRPGLTIANNQIIATGSIGPVSMSMNVPVSHVIDAVKNIVFPGSK